MGSFQNKIKNFERYYGVHLRSLSRSRRFVSLVLLVLFFFLLILIKFSSKPRRTGSYSSLELGSCIQSQLDKYSENINLMNAVVSEWTDSDLAKIEKKSPDGGEQPKSNEIGTSNDEAIDDSNEKLFLPYTGNGYIGISILTKLGLFANFQKSLSLQLNFNPLVQVYSDTLEKNEKVVVEFINGMVHRIECYQSSKDCISIEKTLFAHRTRPSLLIEEIIFNNPSKESVTFDVIQIGSKSWNQSRVKVENINGDEYTISSGIIDIPIDNKLKHLCISIGTTRLPVSIRLREHEFNLKYQAITVVKYSTSLLSGKLENLEPVLRELEAKVIDEIKDYSSIGVKKLKKEHITAWNKIWKSGFGISNSLATGALNGDQINATLYYVLTNNRAPLYEHGNLSIAEAKLGYQAERCYEGFSTLHGIKLWKLPRNEFDVSSLNSIWSLTLQKHGCRTLLDLGVDGILQAVILSIGGFKFTHHHLDLNLNPRQLHRDYQFRDINYANLSLITVEVEVGSDNHAQLYVTLNELIDPNQKFYACDAGCIDQPLELSLNDRVQLPVKMTNPVTAILYISNDHVHINELKHALHVQEVDIAPPQDVNSIAIHKHGHHLAGLATLFWTLFVILIIIFHLFLIKLVYRELCSNTNNLDNHKGYSSYDANKKHRYARTV